jgi:hypothetical protein
MSPRAKKRAPERDHAGSVRESTERREDLPTDLRNVRKDKNRATYALEGGSPTKRPPRKSTRGSSNRSKPDSNLRRRATRAARSPKNRSQMRGA